MKKIVIISTCLLLASFALYAKPSEKLLNLFSEEFPMAENVKWHEDASGYLASFTQAGVLTKVSYDKKSNFQNMLRYYDKSKLPLNILLAVKKRFADKNIFGVTEFTNMEGTAYHIKLEDEKHWYTIKASTSGATIEVEERYKKVS